MYSCRLEVCLPFYTDLRCWSLQLASHIHMVKVAVAIVWKHIFQWVGQCAFLEFGSWIKLDE